MTDLSRASTPDDGVARRTILAGAAWSIPVIATAAVAPAASASGTLALAFNQASYTGTACSTITGAYVTATTNGTPTTGASITVTLSNGYTFAGGSATYTSTSDASGRVSLPAISVPSIGGTSALQGVSGTASSSATATGTPAPATITYYTYNNLGGIPATATITDVATCSDGVSGHWGFARTSDGNIYSSKNGSTFTLFASNTTHLAAADTAAIWSKTDNKVTYYSYTDLGGIPATATITDVATCSDGVSGHWGFARTSDGNIYSSKNGSTFTLFASNTTHLAAADTAAIWSKTDNKVTYYSYTDLGGIPATATITDVATCSDGVSGHWGFARTSDGNIYSRTGTPSSRSSWWHPPAVTTSSAHH
ncbi:hypothetical protein [Microbacterium sp. B19]|uniref:hypothetical protein n=1 Tax=Microbacterium sp. B19 TaxID=96765 RepID=UPI000345E8AA|nr:hypothetical protein [Microbacterium sp. B19]